MISQKMKEIVSCNNNWVYAFFINKIQYNQNCKIKLHFKMLLIIQNSIVFNW